ncbi:MAG: adenine/guanine/hypoxanthine permease [Actinomycetota bacterium]|nr:adenine/guanine/hypoxanthine permease [Actinomycetota bacterium]
MRVTATRLEERRSGVDGFFHISERGSTVRTEIIAGVATWLTMAYILFVNPAILGAVKDHNGVGLAFPQLLTVTALVAGVMTLAMGLYANYPFALAAGLGLNAFVAFTLVAADGLTWPEAMGVIVIEGIVITALVLTGFREAVLNAIPMDLKRAIGIGIGLFIALIGLVNAGVVCGQVKSGSCGTASATVLGLNPNLRQWGIAVFVFGLIVAATLVARRLRGALLISIVLSTILAIIINEAKHLAVWQNGIAAWPHKIFSSPDFGLVGHFSFNVFHVLGIASGIAVVLAVMLSDFFDTMGTVIGISGEAGLLDRDGRLPGVQRVLMVDSLAAAAGGLASASSNTTYIESAAGVSEGGRTGLTSVVVALLFLAALFISPIAGVIPPEATAPVLVIVGYFMMTIVREIEWSDPAIGIPALLTIVLMPFTYSITNGVGAGFIAYTAIALLRGRWRDVHPLMAIVAAVFVWYFVHGLLA